MLLLTPMLCSVHWSPQIVSPVSHQTPFFRVTRGLPLSAWQKVHFYFLNVLLHSQFILTPSQPLTGCVSCQDLSTNKTCLTVLWGKLTVTPNYWEQWWKKKPRFVRESHRVNEEEHLQTCRTIFSKTKLLSLTNKLKWGFEEIISKSVHKNKHNDELSTC